MPSTSHMNVLQETDLSMIAFRSGALSNKPMVPTAPASPAANPLDPLRRHIGQPLDSGMQRMADNVPHATSDSRRFAGNEERVRHLNNPLSHMLNQPARWAPWYQSV